MMKSKSFHGIRKLFFIAFFLIILFGLNESAQARLLNNTLSGDMIDAGDVETFRMSPDGRYVVFVADAHTDNLKELFSVPTTGGARVTLFTAPSENLNIFPKITPDGEHVVFLLGESDRIYDIYNVPITGGTAVKLFESVRIDVSHFDITSDSEQMFFIESLSDPDYHKIIWRVPINGDTPNTIPQDPCEDCEYDYKISSDSQHIAYLEWTDSYSYLFRSDLDGNSHILTPYWVEEYKISPDGTQIVFIQEAPGPSIDLFAAPFNGDPANLLIGGLVDGAEIDQFEITPDSSKVVYLADMSVDDQFLLYAANIDGSANWPLYTGPLLPTNVDMLTIQITPNSQGVVFKADPFINDRYDLFIVSVLGGTPIQLNKNLEDFDYISSVNITPNSLGVVYLAENLSGQMELYAALITGTYETKLNQDLPVGGSVSTFKISPNNQGVVYIADQEINNVHNLYTVPIWGGMEPLQLNAPLISGGEVQRFIITPNSKGVVYFADQLVDGKWELFVTYDYQMVYLPLVVK